MRNSKHDALTLNAIETSYLKELLPEECADHPQQSLREAFARIVWSRLAEPGDSVAGRIVATLGPCEGLNLLINQVSVKNIRELLREDIEIKESEIKAALNRWQPRLDRAASIKDLETGANIGTKIATPEIFGWPKQLEDLGYFAPLMLWCRGDTSLLSSETLAIVGARAATAYGETITAEFASGAVRLGVNTVSGAAYGIDAVAHRSTIAAGGATIAVLAGGVDRFYPAGHTELLNRISVNGLVCSELAPGSAPTRWRFLQRNRLIASLSKAVLVTEAGIRSGSLNTAGHAAQIGRALGAVPGPITSVTSLGTHRLLREYDAQLVANEDDLKQLLGIDPSLSESVELLSVGRGPSIHKRVLDALPYKKPQTTKETAKAAGISVEEAGAVLSELELLGDVECVRRVDREASEWKIHR